MKLPDMKIGVKLQVGFGVILLLVVFLIGLVVMQLNTVAGGAKRIDADLSNSNRAVSLTGAVKDTSMASVEMLLSTNSDHHADALKQIDERNKDVARIVAGLEKDLAGSPKDAKLL